MKRIYTLLVLTAVLTPQFSQALNRTQMIAAQAGLKTNSDPAGAVTLVSMQNACSAYNSLVGVQAEPDKTALANFANKFGAPADTICPNIARFTVDDQIPSIRINSIKANLAGAATVGDVSTQLTRLGRVANSIDAPQDIIDALNQAATKLQASGAATRSTTDIVTQSYQNVFRFINGSTNPKNTATTLASVSVGGDIATTMKNFRTSLVDFCNDVLNQVGSRAMALTPATAQNLEFAMTDNKGALNATSRRLKRTLDTLNNDVNAELDALRAATGQAPMPKPANLYETIQAGGKLSDTCAAAATGNSSAAIAELNKAIDAHNAMVQGMTGMAPSTSTRRPAKINREMLKNWNLFNNTALALASTAVKLVGGKQALARTIKPINVVALTPLPAATRGNNIIDTITGANGINDNNNSAYAQALLNGDAIDPTNPRNPGPCPLPATACPAFIRALAFQIP